VAGAHPLGTTAVMGEVQALLAGVLSGRYYKLSVVSAASVASAESRARSWLAEHGLP
jgi:hypothetical protein